MDTYISVLIDSIENCLLPALSKPLDECEHHPEFVHHDNRLRQYFPRIVNSLGEVNLRDGDKLSTSPLSSLFLLYKELQCDVQKDSEAKYYARELDCTFQLLYGVSLNNLMKDTQFNTQAIFNELLDKLLSKLTLDCWKKYPSLVEVYSSLMGDVKSYKVKLNPVKAFPIAGMLIEDYVVANKLNGVTACGAILMELSPEDFAQSNYYEVIYGSLRKIILDRDFQLTKSSCDSMLLLLRILPSDVCFIKSDQLYSEVLEQVLTEANLYRKSALFHFTAKLIQILKVECVKRRKITAIFHDNLDSCCTEGIAEVLLASVIECYEEWLKHCWCVWKLQKDLKIICVLLKVLYVTKDEKLTEQIVHLVIALVSLCTVEERSMIIKSLSRSVEINSKEYNQKLDLIKNSFV